MRLPLAFLALAAIASAQTKTSIPDLQGIWTNVTLTTMERPAELKDKATLSDAEAKVWETKD